MSAATADAMPPLPAKPAETDQPAAAPAAVALAVAPDTLTAPAVPAAYAAAEAHQLAAESVFWRSIIRGMLIGIVVCMVVWGGIVALATVNNGTNMAANIAMGAGAGVIGGIFLGGTAGAMFGARALEHAEHDELPPAPHE